MLETISNQELRDFITESLIQLLRENKHSHVLSFKLHRFAGELEASHEVITEILPDRNAVKFLRCESEDYNGNSGNLIDYSEAYIALSLEPFSITFRRVVDAGEGEDYEWTLSSVEA